MHYPSHESIIIVASGQSAKDFVPPDDIPVIAVNGVIDWISRADYWFTLDPSPVNINRMSNQRAGVQYFCACPRNVNIPKGVIRLNRLVGNGNKNLRSLEGLSESPGAVHTGNSAYGALGLAKHMRARKVLLVGVDASTEPRCEGGYSNSLSHLPGLFASAIGCGVEFVTVRELHPRIRHMSIEEGLEWLKQ